MCVCVCVCVWGGGGGNCTCEGLNYVRTLKKSTSQCNFLEVLYTFGNGTILGSPTSCQLRKEH